MADNWLEKIKSGTFQNEKSISVNELPNGEVTINGFEYDFYIQDNKITIFLSSSDIGYNFDIVNKKVIWEHPENVQVYYSEELINHINNFVTEVYKDK